MLTLENRIKLIRESVAGMTQKEFANILKTNVARIKSLEGGIVKEITAKEINELVKKFNLSMDWILYNQGEMYQNTKKYEDETNYPIPVLNIHAGAGEGIYNFEDKEDNKYYISDNDYLIIDRRMFPMITDNETQKAIKVDGDSMEPTIPDGSFIVLDEKRKDDHIDGVYVICYSSQIMVKRLQFNLDGSIDIISDNKKYLPKSYNPSVDGDQSLFRILGKKLLVVNTY